MSTSIYNQPNYEKRKEVLDLYDNKGWSFRKIAVKYGNHKESVREMYYKEKKRLAKENQK